MTTVVLPHLEPWQKDVFDYYTNYPNGKWLIIKSFRQSGKSKLAQLLLIYASLSKGDSVSMCVSPMISQSRKMFNDICKMTQDLLVRANASLLEIEFINGSTVLFKSGEQNDSIRGTTIKGSGICIVDEAAYLKDEVFYSVIVPTTTVYNADIFILSTPKFKKGMFYSLFNQGLLDDEKVKSFDWITYDTSKYLPPETKELYKKQMPKLSYKSEILAEFIDGDSTVFSDFKRCIGDYELNPNLPLYISIDWSSGSGQDDTSITLGQVNNGKACISKVITFNDKNANDTIDYINVMIKQFIRRGFKDIYITVEKNSIGAIFSQLLLDTLDYPEVTFNTFTTTNKSKNKIINQLVLLIERNLIVLPNDDKLMVELSAYECTINSNGLAIYNAQTGSRDDMIISTAICINSLYNELL